MRRDLLFLLTLLFVLASPETHADGPAFDLSGPKIDLRVKRGDVTLPVSQVPNLLPGDRLWIHPNLPENQSNHFVLVVAFLRGSTNQPPPQWFTRVETWSREAHDEGVIVTVPAEAQQALLFLAPETGGDFNTLRKAVTDRPGSFVRAANDLQAASWERMRLDAYLADVRVTSQSDPKALKQHAEMAARSLGIKINEECFQRPVDEQASCLSQNSEGIVLDDSGVQSMVDQLAAGSTLDLVNQLSTTTLAGGGEYSPYVGAIVDTAKILSSLHTAHFQYIPALALPTDDEFNLRLNMPPSFRDPKSVVVVALPPIGPVRSEPLYPVNPADSFCALKPSLVLPAQGAPLVFAAQLAHNLVLHIESGGKESSGEMESQSPASVAALPEPGLIATGTAKPDSSVSIDVPVTADASQGGLVLAGPLPNLPAGALIAVMRGKLGFDDWVGPSFHLFSPLPGKWALAPADESALVVGREDTLHLVGEGSQCVQKVEEMGSAGQDASAAQTLTQTLTWTSPKPDTLEVKLPLKGAAPGPVNLAVYQYGIKAPDRLKMIAYDAAASIKGLTLSAGDPVAQLKGTRLDEVAKATLEGIQLTPSTLSRVEDLDELTMKAASPTDNLKPGGNYTAQIVLKDGRELKAAVSIAPPRPEVVLLSKGVQDSGTADAPQVQFGSPDDLPVTGRLVFFLRSSRPADFPRDEKMEFAAADSSFHTMLGVSDGSLLLEDATTAEGAVEPVARFGLSAFGPVRVRPVAANGATGDWVPLGTLVRLPDFKDLRCPPSRAKPCVLSGSNLFLATSIGATPQLDAATPVPPEFTGTQLVVPHPSNGQLYLKLRDDPATVQTVNLPVTTIKVTEAKTSADAGAATEVPASDSTPAQAPAPPASPAAVSPQTPASPSAETPPPQNK